MGATTNPHELKAQYLKARKIATAAFEDGDEHVSHLLVSDAYRIRWQQRVNLATPPSNAVLYLADHLLAETYAMQQEMRRALEEMGAKIN